MTGNGVIDDCEQLRSCKIICAIKVFIYIYILYIYIYRHTHKGQETWAVRTSGTGNFSIRTRKNGIPVVRMDD